jgi:DNA repair protein RadC
MNNLINNQVSEVEITYKNKVKASDRVKITNSIHAINVLEPFYENYIDYKEVSFAIFLNKANHVLAVSKISEGGLCSTVIDQKILFQYALKVNAQSIIISHNHPSGNKTPSEADKKITNQMINAGLILEIKILDHLILTNEGYTSFAEEGLI